MGKDHDVQLLDWDGPHDPLKPVNWSSTKKWTIMLTACLVMFVAELNATSIASAVSETNATFNISDQSFPNSYWPITSWTLAGAICPILLTPIIEDHGVRPGFLITYLVFCIFVIPQAVAGNFATLIVTRIFAGGAGATIAALVDGIAADLWEEDGVGEDGERIGGRGKAVTVYTYALVGGYTIGPVFGGAVIKTLEWRWILYIQLILSFSLLPLLYIILPETRAPLILKARAQHLREKTSAPIYTAPELSSSSTLQHLREALLRPTQLLFTEPVLASFTLWSSFTLGMIFSFTQSIPQVFSSLYNWDESETGVVQISIFVGQTLGLAACLTADHYFIPPHGRGTQSPLPEKRLHLSIPATLLGLAGGFFWYAWTSSPNLHWILPTVGLAFVGFGMMCVVTAVDLYITDAYAAYAGSAIAAVTFGENLVSGLLPLSTMRMYDRLGFHWASSVLGFVSLALCVAPLVLVWKGEGIRRRSRFMNAGVETKEMGQEGEDGGVVGAGGRCANLSGETIANGEV